VYPREVEIHSAERLVFGGKGWVECGERGERGGGRDRGGKAVKEEVHLALGARAIIFPEVKESGGHLGGRETGKGTMGGRTKRWKRSDVEGKRRARRRKGKSWDLYALSQLGGREATLELHAPSSLPP
jgi:hypothetical protein